MDVYPQLLSFEQLIFFFFGGGGGGWVTFCFNYPPKFRYLYRFTHFFTFILLSWNCYIHNFYLFIYFNYQILEIWSPGQDSVIVWTSIFQRILLCLFSWRTSDLFMSAWSNQGYLHNSQTFSVIIQLCIVSLFYCYYY